jgi:DNA-binding XRE family transcriptional regulator
VRVNQLSKRESEICERVRKIREKLGLTQDDCAQKIGIKRATLVNYESGRTPLQFDIALRICRQLIISEEWLATGCFEACHAAAKIHGETGKNGWNYMDEKIYIRQCMDLFSEPITLHQIPPGMLFSSAYDVYLSSRYLELETQSYLLPRISFTDADSSELFTYFINVLNERFAGMIENEGRRTKKNFVLMRRLYFARTLDTMHLIFMKFMGFDIEQKTLNRLEWLKQIVSDPNAQIIPPEYVGEMEDYIQKKQTQHSMSVREKELEKTC